MHCHESCIPIHFYLVITKGPKHSFSKTSFDRSFPGRFDFSAIFARLTAIYQRGVSTHNAPHNFACSVCPPLRRLVRLRAQYNTRERVAKSHSITKTKQVIYAIFNCVNHKVYVGLTRRTAAVRFKEHLRSARLLGRQQRGGVHPDHKVNSPLYRDMVKLGWRNFGLFVLQKVPGRYSKTHEGGWTEAQERYTQAARPRELWWIFHLRSFRWRDAGEPGRGFRGGYNVEMLRTRKRRSTEMKHNRHRVREGRRAAA
jgi:hypothetical protein